MRWQPCGSMTEVVTAEEQLENPEPEVPTRRLLVFEVGGEVFATDMGAVREIVPSQPVTRLPGAPLTVSGLINLRGTIVTVLDAGTCLAKSPWRRNGGLVLLAGHGDSVIGVGSDDVRDIHGAPDSGIICGVVQIGSERVLLLDVPVMVREVLGQQEAG